MTAMRRLARRLLVEDAAATAIEYALLAALIGGVIIATVAGMGQTLGGIYSRGEHRNCSACADDAVARLCLAATERNENKCKYNLFDTATTPNVSEQCGQATV